MGVFTDQVRKPRRTKHRRIATFAVEIPTRYIEELRNAIEVDTTGKWNATRISQRNGTSEIHISYGPVYGGSTSDVRRFLARHAGIGDVFPKEIFEEHVDDCEHDSHDDEAASE